MSQTTTPSPLTPQGNVPAIGVPDSQDYPRLVYTAPYFEQVALAELIEPSVIEAIEGALPSLVPPYVQGAANDAVQQLAVLLAGSTMTGPLFLSPVIPTQPSQAASMAYVDAMIATAGIPEVPPVPSGQIWGRETGQWVPINQQEGTFLPLAGGTMQGQINMSGNTIVNMAAIPVMPNGAAPAQWVLNQIAAQSLYQGTWDADTNVPDLTQPATHQNGFTWIATTAATGGVVVGQPIPGLQGQTVFNGDTIIYSATQGVFNLIHAGGMSFAEAQAYFLPLAGGQLSGPLLLNANASQPMQAVTLQQLDAFVPPGAVGEAPNDGQLYGRNGLTSSWAPVLPLAGGILTGALTLFGNATQALQAVPFQQLNSAISSAVASYLPLAGGTMSGLLTLSGNATSALNPTTLQQVSGMLGGYLPISGGTLTGGLTLAANAAQPLQPVSLQQMQGTLGSYVTEAGPSQINQATINQPVIMGVTDGSNAAPGQVGEYISNMQSTPVTVFNSTWQGLASISLTSGDWDVQAFFSFTNTSGVSRAVIVLSGTAANSGDLFPQNAQGEVNVIGGGNYMQGGSVATSVSRRNVTAPTPLYCNVWLQYTASTATATAFIWARRVR